MNKKLTSLLIANLFAVAPALADDFQVGGSVGIGGMGVDDKDAVDASKFNEFRDMTSGALFNFDLKGRSNSYWLEAFGENPGRDDHYLNIRGGMYDVFKYRIYSDQLKHNFLFNGVTPYQGAGSATQTATLPSLNPAAWNSLDIGYKRRDDGLMFEYQRATPWYGRVEANQVTWKGSKPGAAAQGTSPGNGFADFAFPVDYKTKNATVEGGYNTREMHFDLSWMTSKFENENESFTWTNGFFANGTDRTYLAADNRYTRLAGNATFRKLPFDSTFAARFTSDELKSSVPLGTSVLNTGGNIASTGPSTGTFDGKVKNETVTLALASAPARGTDVRAYYNYRKRDDQSTRVEFNSTAIAGPFENEPFSYKKNDWGIDGSYRINRGNRIGAGFDYLDTKREGRFDFDRTKDRRYYAEWKNTSIDELAVRVKYSRLERKSDFLLGEEGTGTGDVNYLNRFVTAFDLSNVDQDQWKVMLDFTPMPYVDLSFEGIVKNNKYKDNLLGRLKDDRSEVYVSASFGAPGTPRVTVFFDSEDIKYDSQHRIVPFGSTATGVYDPNSAPTTTAYNWTGTIKDRNSAAGVALDWPATEKLSIKASAIYYKTDGSVDLALQDGTPASVTVPGSIGSWDDSKRTTISVKAVYAYSKSWSVTGGYAYEKYEFTDSQYSGYRNTIPANNNANSYLDGVYANPQYKANIVYALVTYHF